MKAESRGDSLYAYTLLLRRSPETLAGSRYEFYECTGDPTVPFARVHSTATVAAMLDFVRAYVWEEVLFELADNPFFWEGASEAVLRIADPDLRAFVQYALCGIVAPIYTLDEAGYLAGILDDRSGWHFVIGWEAQPPLHDVAYCILEFV